MAVICYTCAKARGVNLPPVRVAPEKCDFCEADGIPPTRPRNYDVPDMQLPGSASNPNVQAEKEEGTGGGEASGRPPTMPARKE